LVRVFNILLDAMWRAASLQTKLTVLILQIITL